MPRQLRVFRDSDHAIIRLDHVPFSWQALQVLSMLSIEAPNMRLEGIEEATGKKVRVPLYDIFMDFTATNRINIP